MGSAAEGFAKLARGLLRKDLRTTLFVLYFTVIPLLTLGCQFEFGGKRRGGDNNKSVAVPINVQAVSRGDISAYLHLNAVLEAGQNVRIFSRTTGRVIKRTVEVGDRVTEGQLLILLDDEEPRLALEKARAVYSRDSAAAARAAELFSHNMLSEDEYQQTLLILRESSLTVEQFELAYRYTRITAPFDGAVAAIEVNLGDRVDPARPLLTLVGGELRLSAWVNPDEINQIKPGVTADILLQEGNAPAAVCKLVSISPVVDPTFGKVKVIFEVANPPANLQPGQFVTVRLLLDRHENALRIPRQAIIHQGTKPFVFIKKDTVALRREVALGMQMGEFTEVTDGINEGDTIIVEGHITLRDSAWVRVIAN